MKISLNSTRRYSLKQRKRLLEFKLKQLKQDDPNFLKSKLRSTSQNLEPKYLGIDRNGVCYFKCNSGTHPGEYVWRQKVQLLDLQKAIDLQKEDPSLSNRDVVNLAIFGDLAIYCNDPSYLYWGWQYIDWQLGAGLEPEDRFPHKRNPKLRGMMCKHLRAVLTALPFYIQPIISDLIRLGVLKGNTSSTSRASDLDLSAWDFNSGR